MCLAFSVNSKVKQVNEFGRKKIKNKYLKIRDLYLVNTKKVENTNCDALSQADISLFKSNNRDSRIMHEQVNTGWVIFATILNYSFF